MGRIRRAFDAAASEGRAALIIYLCAGDPDLAATPTLIRAAAEAGADIIELGMPFSDPAADGPEIQRASERALAAGTTFDGVLNAVREVRASGCDVPLMLFGYFNPIVARGELKAVADAADAGVDGFLVVDLPPEEAGGFTEALAARGLDYVPLVAPTTSDARARVVAERATGFVYSVSMTGVTGARSADLAAAGERAAHLESLLERPVGVGFGIKTPSDVRAVAACASGVVVGSAAVAVIHEGGAPALRALVRSLRAALDA